ncbi:hypothetical protein CEXT_16261 [Caerostris extrusa]|uniref:Uncharacterized protein n=1 Tax=Caerostris extrusa TaxID=172846 RepID=A0AAV4UK18_CAEEX|nr:hypothetical protein CEXT_16261 [Caerostris extrusa]
MQFRGPRSLQEVYRLPQNEKKFLSLSALTLARAFPTSFHQDLVCRKSLRFHIRPRSSNSLEGCKDYI